ncbi:MAG: OmpA family protein [Proteobacteria bacterium]|jgi:peptidoglycan-associated lipoprotein|nr:OmpA family protein [Pseudomonadota bacterium]MDA1239051.1 OmpA family protein [Pseudomonadota bacterium]
MSIFSKMLLISLMFSITSCTENVLSGSEFNRVPTEVNNLDNPNYFIEVVGSSVFFRTDGSILSKEAKDTLMAQVNWLLINKKTTAIIEGHSDELGTREYNLALGARRAAASRDFLVANGVEVSRLRILTFGKERPAEICSAELCYSKNRRSSTILDR